MEHMSSRAMVLIVGEAVDAVLARHRPEIIQELLEKAHDGGKAECMCTVPYLRLLVKKRGKKMHLAAWPDQSHRHHPACVFYSPAQEEIDRAYGSGVIRNVSNGTSVTTCPSDAYNENMLGVKGTLYGVLNELWVLAKMNCWVPGWSREWSMVKDILDTAADRLIVNGQRLSKMLYIPPNFIYKKKEEINAQWERFSEPFKALPRGDINTHTAFVLGKVSSLEKAEDGYYLRFQNHYVRFLIPERMYANLVKLCRAGFTELTKAKPESDVIALLRIVSTRRGQLVAADCVLMRVGKKLLPSNNFTDDEVIDHLVATNREFVRPLSHGQARGNLPAFVLVDTPVTNTELFITGNGFPQLQIRRYRIERTEEARSRGNEAIFWNKPDPMPKMPSPANEKAKVTDSAKPQGAQSFRRKGQPRIAQK